MATLYPNEPDLELVISESAIRQRIQQLAEKISADYGNSSLVLLGVLNGAFIFMADLVRELAIPAEIDFIRLASYGDSTYSSGTITITKDIEVAIAGKDVLIIEDIIDTGRTIAWLIAHLQKRQPQSVQICTLIDKKERRQEPVSAKYCGFNGDRGFLVGYGLDYAGNHRQHKGIFTLRA